MNNMDPVDALLYLLTGRTRTNENAHVRCPHCAAVGTVTTAQKAVKRGISGGKATAAFLTGGLSLFGTGLSRKQTVTEASCRNCKITWTIE